jgi:hypothetical protein
MTDNSTTINRRLIVSDVLCRGKEVVIFNSTDFNGKSGIISLYLSSFTVNFAPCARA